MESKDLLKQKRIELGLTQLDVARAVGVSEATISRWESGDIENMRRNNISALAKVLHISPHLIIDWNDLCADDRELIEEATRYLVGCGSSVSVEEKKVYIIKRPDLVPIEELDFLNLLFSIKQFYKTKGISFDEAIREYFGNIAVTNPKLLTSNLNAENFADSKKYRALDEHGMRMVNMVLNEEYERCQAVAEEAEIRIVPLSLLPASAGAGEWLDDGEWDEIEIPNTKEYKAADFAIRVEGDSMLPTFEDGDIVLVHKQDAVNVGDVGIFIVDDKGYIKEQGKDRLISQNKEYPDIYPNEFSSVFVAGKVIGKIKKEG